MVIEADLRCNQATGGKNGSFTAKNAKIAKLKSAAYNGATNTVTLTPKKPFALTKSVQRVVYGTGSSGLQDTYGRFIDGDHKGTPGGDAVAILTRGGATIEAIVASCQLPVAREDGNRRLHAAVVDALLEREDLHHSTYRDR
jgi:hypothetical protein